MSDAASVERACLPALGTVVQCCLDANVNSGSLLPSLCPC